MPGGWICLQLMLQVERITGRLVHPASGRSYHERFAPPKVRGFLLEPLFSVASPSFSVRVAEVQRVATSLEHNCLPLL